MSKNPTGTFFGCDKAFNVIKSDLTVQATYTQNPVYTVTFVDWDGSIIATVKVEDGKSAVKPDDPIREGYTFIGWDKEFDNVTSDLTVTALYEEIIVVDYTPTNLSVVVEALGDDDQQITLSWNAVDGAASYDLRLRRTTCNSYWETRNSMPVTPSVCTSSVSNSRRSCR